MEYFDYQQFLKDFYEATKSDKFFFSYRYMGQKVGLDAGFLVRVLQGRSHLSPKSIPAFTLLCGFSEEEAEYFDVLIKYAKASSAGDIKLYFEKLLSLKGVRADVLEAHQYAFYQKWYHSAIHALLTFRGFTGNYKWLARTLTPPISAKEAQSSIMLLEKVGLVTRDANGVFRASSAFITTGDKWKSAAVRAFQVETIRLADESLERHAKEIRDISTVTIAVSRRDLPAIQDRIREFRQSLLQLATSDHLQADSVYQVNIQVFPLALPEADRP